MVAFRRARGLVAGDDYLAWLSERSLSPADVEAHLARAALREPLGGGLETHHPDPERITLAIRAEAILGGNLRGWVERLARCAAAGSPRQAPATGPPP